MDQREDKVGRHGKRATLQRPAAAAALAGGGRSGGAPCCRALWPRARLCTRCDRLGRAAGALGLRHHRAATRRSAARQPRRARPRRARGPRARGGGKAGRCRGAAAPPQGGCRPAARVVYRHRDQIGRGGGGRGHGRGGPREWHRQRQRGERARRGSRLQAGAHFGQDRQCARFSRSSRRARGAAGHAGDRARHRYPRRPCARLRHRPPQPRSRSGPHHLPPHRKPPRLPPGDGCERQSGGCAVLLAPAVVLMRRWVE